MLLIFNYAGIAFCVLALFGGWGVKFSAWAIGLGDSANDLGVAAGWCAVAALLDLVCRSTGILNSSPRSWLRFVSPYTGGQVFFIPIWTLATVLLCYQLVSVLI